MQIHIVQQGQSLYSIAQAYGTSVQEIVRTNEIPNSNTLVIGQAIVIPIQGRFHWVQPGDSLYKIGQVFGFTAAELARINNIPLNRPLSIGFRIYIPKKEQRPVESNAYIEPRGTTVAPSLEQAARDSSPYLTYLGPFSFQIQRDGTLKAPLLNNFPTIAKQNDVTLMMAITNQENDQFSDELGRIILTNMDIQNKLLNNIVITAKKYGFRDIHFDMEYLRPQDREAYNQFLRKAKSKFKQEGWLLSTALAPKTSAGQKGRWYENGVIAADHQWLFHQLIQLGKYLNMPARKCPVKKL
jgi:spore germination protein